MLDMRIDGDFTPAVGLFDRVKRQIPYATAVAINTTLDGAQRDIRVGMNQRFILRRKTFIERTIKIAKPDRADKRKLVGTIRVDPNRPILAKHEKRGTKRPRGQHIAVPTGAYRGQKAIPKSKRPKAFNFRRVGRAIRGDKRTFILPGKGIYQKVGRGRKKTIKQLYVFKRSVPISARLNFVDTTVRVVRRDYGRNFHKALRRAMRTAR